MYVMIKHYQLYWTFLFLEKIQLFHVYIDDREREREKETDRQRQFDRQMDIDRERQTVTKAD